MIFSIQFERSGITLVIYIKRSFFHPQISRMRSTEGSRFFLENHPLIPWYKIIGMRNVLIHEYDHVDPDLVWETIRRDIPELEEQLRNIIE